MAMELPPGTQVTTATQSDYRESEAQTAPYAPDYQIPAAPLTKQQHLTAARHLPEGVPEVLTLQLRALFLTCSHKLLLTCSHKRRAARV